MSSIRFAFRQLALTPGFTAVAVITLALGIGVNTAMFTVLNTFMLQPLPFPDADRLFRLDRTTEQEPQGRHRGPNFIEIERQSRGIADLAAYTVWAATLTQPGRPAEMVGMLRASARLLDVLQIRPAIGRAFRPEEDAPGRNHVVILSDPFWRSHFNADPHVVGRTLKLKGEIVEIVGVLPPEARASQLFDYEFIRPLALSDEERTFQSETFFMVLGRYRPGTTAEAAQAHFDVVASRLASERPNENAGMRLQAMPPLSSANDVGRTVVLLLLGLSGFVLLIACANLANLLISRAMSRSREFATRAALGASRLQLVRPLVLECLLIVIAGGIASWSISRWTIDWLGRQFGEASPVVFIQDWRVVAFATAAAAATALFVAAAPGWLISRINVNDTLKAGGRSATNDPSQHRFRNILVAGQIALTLVLLAGAVGFARGLNQAMTRDMGWKPGPLLSGRLGASGEDEQAVWRFHRQLRDRLAALPGVQSASVDVDLPLYPFQAGQRAYVVDGRERPEPGREPTAITNLVSPEYFETIGQPLLRGRGFLVTDTHDAPPVVIINEAMARTLFPDGDAIGRRLGRVDRDAEWAEIVGIARDIRFPSLGAAPTRFQVYKPLGQETWGWVCATVRVADDASPAALVDPLRRAVAELDPEIPVLQLMPVATTLRMGNRDLATVTQLLSGFAALGVFLAALGLYGVVLRLVTQRTVEIGIRMALGATVGHVVRLVLSTGIRMTTAGVAIGLLGAWGLTRLLNTQLPGLATGHVVTVAAAAALLSVVALIACYLPARRAAKVDPLVAIRAE